MTTSQDSVTRLAIADHLQRLADTPEADGPWWALRDSLLAEAGRLRTACPCVNWAGDIRVPRPNGHHPLCDGNGHHHVGRVILADSLSVAERMRLLIPTLRAGLDWLFDVAQPDDALCTQFGRSLDVPEANRRLSFGPITFGRGATCIVYSVINVRREDERSWSPALNGFATGEHVAFADAIRALGYDIVSAWSGKTGSTTGSVSLSREPHPSLWAAYLRYNEHGTGHHSALATIVLPAGVEHLHNIDAGGHCRDPQCDYSSDVAHDKAVSDYLHGEGPSPYGDVPLSCTNPRHAHALNDAEAAKGGPDEDPVTWSHCAGCHGDDYDHGTDLTGPRCGHFAGCPNC